MSQLLEIQPSWCREPLKQKDIEWYKGADPDRVKLMERVLFFDPSEVYERLAPTLNCYSRNPKIQMAVAFPNTDTKACACGCGKELKGRRTRWATDECSNFASKVHFVISGYLQSIGPLVRIYYGHGCAGCGQKQVTKQIDHKWPVKMGGGGGWLSNYQLLCHECHVDKTNRDFKRKQYANIEISNQLLLPIS